jgi:hypothetical protein
MNLLLALCISAGSVQVDPTAADHEGGSFLCQPSSKVDKAIRLPTRLYVPQVGDMVFAAKNDFVSVLGHVAAGTGYPNHSAIVFQQHDGTLALLEAGPEGHLREGMAIVSLMQSLRTKEEHGRAWVRARSTPLTPDQSARLTEYAYREAGKRFALVRIYGQLSPFRSRFPLRTAFLGKPDPDRNAYFCSELVLNGLVWAGLVDDRARPTATYPRDLYKGHSRNHFVDRGVAELNEGWDPPARWTSTADASTVSDSSKGGPLHRSKSPP